jgi:HrpA-like RNA helicase
MDGERMAEILRSPFHATLLKLKYQKKEHLDFIESVPEKEKEEALKLLYFLGAVDSNRNITEMGEKLALLPVMPEEGRALLESVDLNCSEELCKLFAMTSLGPYYYKLNKKVRTAHSYHFLTSF